MFASRFVLTLILIAPTAIAEDFAAKAQGLLEVTLAEFNLVGLSAAIGRDGEILWTGGAGFSNREDQIPATSDMVHRIASITKSMTATAIMQLVNDKKVKLKSPLQVYLPNYPTTDEGPIRIQHLLTHTSGIRHYNGTENRPTNHYPTLTAALDVFKNDRVPFEPGTRYRYTTYGYTVLGAVIESVSGQSYGDYMKQHLWDPAGMMHTSLEIHGEVVPNKSRLYVKDPDGNTIQDQYTDLSIKYPGGGVQCTAQDLVRFAIAFENGTLLPKKVREKMMDAPDVRGRRKGLNYGYGWFYNDSETLGRYIQNDGGQSGTSTNLIIFQDHNVYAAVLANEYGQGRATALLNIELAKLAINEI